MTCIGVQRIKGWVTGTSYGIIGPWSLGVSQIHFSGAFKADAWFSLLEKESNHSVVHGANSSPDADAGKTNLYTKNIIWKN